MAESTLREHLGLGQVEPCVFKKAPLVESPDPLLLYGVELEIEGPDPHITIPVRDLPVDTPSSDWVVSGLRIEADGSLRNGGQEFITKPMTYSNTHHCLTKFFTQNKISQHNYSERCSVHVHTNCLDLTYDQLSSICILYQVLEPVLFNFVGGDRDKNIFCVPLAQTNLSYNVVTRIANKDYVALKRWQKYTALNLLPLCEQGTLEWRHMGGTNDIKHIFNWMGIIGSIYAWARANTLAQTKDLVLHLNTNSKYKGMLETIFMSYSPLLMADGFESCLEDGVLNMKYSLLGEAEKRAPAQWESIIRNARSPDGIPENDDNVTLGDFGRARDILGEDTWSRLSAETRRAEAIRYRQPVETPPARPPTTEITPEPIDLASVQNVVGRETWLSLSIHTQTSLLRQEARRRVSRAVASETAEQLGADAQADSTWRWPAPDADGITRMQIGSGAPIQEAGARPRNISPTPPSPRRRQPF